MAPHWTLKERQYFVHVVLPLSNYATGTNDTDWGTGFDILAIRMNRELGSRGLAKRVYTKDVLFEHWYQNFSPRAYDSGHRNGDLKVRAIIGNHAPRHIVGSQEDLDAVQRVLGAHPILTAPTAVAPPPPPAEVRPALMTSGRDRGEAGSGAPGPEWAAQAVPAREYPSRTFRMDGSPLRSTFDHMQASIHSVDDAQRPRSANAPQSGRAFLSAQQRRFQDQAGIHGRGTVRSSVADSWTQTGFSWPPENERTEGRCVQASFATSETLVLDASVDTAADSMAQNSYNGRTSSKHSRQSDPESSLGAEPVKKAPRVVNPAGPSRGGSQLASSNDRRHGGNLNISARADSSSNCRSGLNTKRGHDVLRINESARPRVPSGIPGSRQLPTDTSNTLSNGSSPARQSTKADALSKSLWSDSNVEGSASTFSAGAQGPRASKGALLHSRPSAPRNKGGVSVARTSTGPDASSDANTCGNQAGAFSSHPSTSVRGTHETHDAISPKTPASLAGASGNKENVFQRRQRPGLSELPQVRTSLTSTQYRIPKRSQQPKNDEAKVEAQGSKDEGARYAE